jgi:hypothetical protein
MRQGVIIATYAEKFAMAGMEQLEIHSKVRGSSGFKPF